MAYKKLLSASDILETALHLVESIHPRGLSLRAVATAMGVKAPSLYRYYPDKSALEAAVAEKACEVLLEALDAATFVVEPSQRFLAIAEAYLRFARERFTLYAFTNAHISQIYGSPASKAAWNVLLKAASDVSGYEDDTAAAVATWSLLHGYALLEQAGAFGASGPLGGLERGLEAFLSQFKARTKPH